jgi:hypothetical protein
MNIVGRVEGAAKGIVNSLFVYLALMIVGLAFLLYAWLVQPQGLLHVVPVAWLSGLVSGCTYEPPFFGGDWRYDGSPLWYLFAYHVVNGLVIVSFDRWLSKKIRLFQWRVAIALPVAVAVSFVCCVLEDTVLGG